MTRGVRGISFEQLMVGLLFGALAAAACLMPAQPDTFWHLRAGEEIWATTTRTPPPDGSGPTTSGSGKRSPTPWSGWGGCRF